ncbi:MAG: hypothetical protein V1831_00060 [Candidatus Woesearchaeota archaeon]
MKILSVIIGLFLVLAMVPMVLSANENGNIISGGKLIITDMDVKVGSKTDKNMDFGDNIRYEAKPGDKVQFQIEFKNNFTNDEDLKIEDIGVTVTILDIDDGDDLEDDAKDFDLRPGRDEKITIEFEIPLEVDEDTYDVLIEAEGEDENGTTHEVQYELTLEVQKEDYEVLFTRNSLTPSEIKCGRTIQLLTAVINTGADDEDAVVLEVSNTELGVSFRDTFDLTNDPFDDDSKFTKTYTFTVPKEVLPGVYTIQSKVTFEDGDSTETATSDLVVAQCEIVAEPVKEESKEEVKTGEVVVVQQPTVTEPTNVITAGTVTAPTLPATEEESLFGTSGFLIALIAGEVLLLIVAILIIVAVVKRKGE